jgi:hypothetical protein
MPEPTFSSNDVPDYYIDATRMGITPFGITIQIGVSGEIAEAGEVGPVKILATIRMSPQHALIFAKVMLKNMQVYQEKVGRIELPAQIYKEMGIEPD